MKHKKIAAAVMATVLLGTMTAVSASAEESGAGENMENAENVEVVQNAEDTAADTAADAQAADAPAATDAPVMTDAPAESVTEPETDAPDAETEPIISTTMTETVIDMDVSETKLSTTTTETTTTETEIISKDLKAPEMGNFKVETTDASGQVAYISWNPVAGAEGYEIYRVEVREEDKDTPTAYPFDAGNKTSYQTSASVPVKETIRVRAYKTVDDKKVYGPWSEEKTVYLNGMKEDPVATKASTSTTKAKETTKSTTKAETKSDEALVESPKTGDVSGVGLLAGAAAVALLSGAITRNKKQD